MRMFAIQKISSRGGLVAAAFNVDFIALFVLGAIVGGRKKDKGRRKVGGGI